MTTDNRTNEPTEEQVEAAAKAIADCHNPGMFEKYPENWRVEARAALAAAAGVAEAAKLHRPTLPGFGPKSCVHDGRAWPCPDSIALGLNEGSEA